MLHIFLKLTFFVSLLGLFSADAFADGSNNRVFGQYLVRFHAPMQRAAVKLLDRQGVRIQRQFQNVDGLVHIAITAKRLKGFGDVASVDKWLRSLFANVAYVEPVYHITLDDAPITTHKRVDDPEIPKRDEFPFVHGEPSKKQWGLSGKSGVHIDVRDAWELTPGNADIVVAVIDSGVDYTHRDLQHNIWRNRGEIADNGIDDDDNGYIDDVAGWDFYNHDNRPYDDHGHGTHCAGIIAANSNDLVGVAPGVRILPLKFMNAKGSGTTAGAIAAIDYAISMGVRVLSNSWGGGDFSQGMRDVIARANAAGVLFVTSAGNKKRNIDKRPTFPSSYRVDNIINVASVTKNGYRSSFSNYGATRVHLAAPGSHIYSTVPNDKRSYKSGTSMAGPFVAGVAALVLSLQPQLPLYELKRTLLQSVQPVVAMEGKTTTGGTLNAYFALMGQFDAGIVVPASIPLPVALEGTRPAFDVHHFHPWFRRHRTTVHLRADSPWRDAISEVHYISNTGGLEVFSDVDRLFKYRFLTRKRSRGNMMVQILLKNGAWFEQVIAL